MESDTKFKAAVIGATGGVGQKIVELLNKDDRCSEIRAIIRKPREEWLTEEFKEKLNMIEVDDLSKMSTKKSELEGCDIFFSCLGSRVGRGKDLFFKVDHDYPLEFAQMSIDLNAHAFYLVSSVGAKESSCNHYLKVKGQTENDMKALKHNNLWFARPGLLLERNNDKRFGEKIGAWIPFLGKITCRNVAKAMIEHSYASFENKEKDQFSTLNNSTLKKIAKTSKLV